MTYDDDMVRIYLAIGEFTLPLKSFGLEWPPPAELTELNGVSLGDDVLVLTQCSEITDEQRATMTNVARACVYRYKHDLDQETS